MRDLETIFKALGDETRLQMLWLLLNHKELCVCDFMEVLKITQSKSSRHLRNLFHAGLVNDRREGLWVHYSLQTRQKTVVRSVLRTIKTEMSDQKQASEILNNLHNWLKVKAKGKSCRACA